MKIRKADIILAVVIAIIGIIASVYLTLHDTDVRNGQVVVYVDSVKQGKINDMSKSIICLPHKVVVEIQSDDRKYDAVSG